MPDFGMVTGGATESASTPAASTAISVTSSASTNTMGSWTPLLTSTLYASDWMGVSLVSGVGAGRSFLVDLGVGASTAEKVLVAGLGLECKTSASHACRQFIMPLRLPAGVRLSARTQSTTGSSTLYVGVTLHANTLGSPIGGAHCESFGVDASGSTGTAIDPGGVAHTDSAWMIGSTTTFPWRWCCVSLLHVGALTAIAHWLIDIGVGANPNQKVLIPDLFASAGTSADTPIPGSLCLPVSIPAGTVVSLRARSNNITAADRVFNAIITGVG